MTTVYTFPQSWYEKVTTNSSFYLRPRSLSASRPWLGGDSVYGPHAQPWVCSITLPKRTSDIWMPMSAFFSRTDGRAGLIRIGDPARLRLQYDREVATGSVPFSDGTFFADDSGWEDGPLPATLTIAAAASRGDNSVVLGGLPVSRSRILRRGDLFEVMPAGIQTAFPNLYEAMADCDSDSAGKTGVEIRPRLRMDLAVIDVVSVRGATSVFQCVDDDQGKVSVSAPLFGEMTFSLIEAPPL